MTQEEKGDHPADLEVVPKAQRLRFSARTRSLYRTGREKGHAAAGRVVFIAYLSPNGVANESEAS